MNIEIEVTGINAVYPHKKNAIIIGTDVEDIEGFAHSIFNGMEDTKAFQEFRLAFIKNCISSFLDCEAECNQREFFDFVENVLSESNYYKKS